MIRFLVTVEDDSVNAGYLRKTIQNGLPCENVGVEPYYPTTASASGTQSGSVTERQVHLESFSATVKFGMAAMGSLLALSIAAMVVTHGAIFGVAGVLAVAAFGGSYGAQMQFTRAYHFLASWIDTQDCRDQYDGIVKLGKACQIAAIVSSASSAGLLLTGFLFGW